MSESPIGIFDSGIGGLSVLQSLQALMPAEHGVYWSDSAHAPYGEKSEAFVRQRSLAIAQHMIDQHHIKALVVACNTATAATIQDLRQRHPQLSLIGVEPALKPALQLSRTQHIGVIGTRGTLGSDKFKRLLVSLQDQAEFSVQACNGLALAIEQSVSPDAHPQAHAQITELLRKYLQALGTFGTQSGQIDTLVLGCTHYVFVEPVLRQLLGPHVHLVSTGEPVAKQTQRLLQAAGLLRSASQEHATTAHIRLMTNGDLTGLQAAAQRWLGLPESACERAAPQV